MHNTAEIEKIVTATLYSGFLKNEKPLSIFLVASAGSGKTSLLNQFHSISLWNESDISQKTMALNLERKISEGVTHLVIGDFIAIQSHSYKTIASIIGILNRLIEEGIKDEDFFGQSIHLKETANLGLITSTTIEKFEDLFVSYSDIGFFDRVIPVFYKLSDKSLKEVNERIKAQVNDYEIRRLKLRKNKIDVNIPLGLLADRIEVMSNQIMSLQKNYCVKRNNPKGIRVFKSPDTTNIRTHKRLRVFAKSLALMRDINAKEVNASDINQLESLYKYIGLRAISDITEV
jgi:hypothetical protein